MAASRRVLEALLARVQQRAAEPRQPGASATLELVRASAAPAANPSESPTLEVHEDEDIEEYDDELIEIIDDAAVIPQAAATARAIEPKAFRAVLDRRSASPASNGAASRAPAPRAPSSQRAPERAPASQRSPSPARSPERPPERAPASERAPVSQRPEPSSQRTPERAPASQRPVAPVEALRGESIAPRPVAPAQVALARGEAREVRSASFLELLDASLKLGS